MKERQIFFRAPMVRAILDGRKTQTRRVVKPQPRESIAGNLVGEWLGRKLFGLLMPKVQDIVIHCPYGQSGDRLWVRETWNHSNFPFGPYEENCDVFYRADYFDDPLGTDLERSEDGIRRTWKSPIHMPRSASRITLEITGVRVERLQDISEADAIAEGCNATLYIDDGLGNRVPPKGNTIRDSYPSARHWYASTWDDINGPGSWSANPWVWVIEFKRVL
ncbi:MAG: hypothetical protein ACXV9R_10340 [Methylobacter sp.]